MWSAEDIEKLRKQVYSESLEPVDYNSAVLYLCRKIIEFAERNPQKWREILAMYKCIECLNKEKFWSDEQKYAVNILYQDMMEVVFDHLTEVMDDELEAEIEKLAPSTFAWSCAMNRAVILTRTEFLKR